MVQVGRGASTREQSRTSASLWQAAAHGSSYGRDRYALLSGRSRICSSPSASADDLPVMHELPTVASLANPVRQPRLNKQKASATHHPADSLGQPASNSLDFFGLPPSFPFLRAASALAALEDAPPILPISAAIHRFEPRKPSRSAGM